MWVCALEKSEQSLCSVCVGASLHSCMPPPTQAGQNGTGRRAPNWAQMAATDKDGGGMNMLINNYQNSDIQ